LHSRAQHVSSLIKISQAAGSNFGSSSMWRAGCASPKLVLFIAAFIYVFHPIF
jgi:hypothetical protein